MKGIILAGGKGTRLYPMTKVVSKQLLPLYDKPMIYYPLSTLMLAGIKEVLIISTPKDLPLYKELLGDGSDLGMKLSYKVQKEARGKTAAKIRKGGIIFGSLVEDPRAFGVVEIDKNFNAISIEEKPEKPKSKWAVPGLYFYGNSVVEIAKTITPSERGELEITSINNEYLKRNQLKVVTLGRGVAWLDTGTPKGMSQASHFIEIVQERQGFYISCLEEIAYRQGFIDVDKLIELGTRLNMTDYGKYILNIAKEREDA